jgi:hypothetical protein
MGYLEIELARTIDEDRYREAERRHRINTALAMRQEQYMSPVLILIHWLRSLIRQEQRLATRSEAGALAELRIGN